ncbi:DeoR family transcriptional regulator [Pectinatus frisingensis]|uniref:DeoR family transcriptional regulator n=1 Tax=Pectinatus frisingensis TaxID=865 RepID=UPI0015F3F1F1|nr:DeoR/GlpR family DNA-binding transcription regulator [Pectinatus frisingensis]
MLAAQRYAKIIQLLNHKQSVSVAELSKLLQASEATVRRDINVLHTKGSLIKVYGGAMSAEDYTTTEDKVEIRKTVHVSEKELIAITAAKLIKAKDIVYIDAGTTTELLLKYLRECIINCVNRKETV